MCGICGLINLDNKPVSQEKLQLMTKSLSHRGPDNEGTFIKNNFGFGHLRLSILDLSTKGNQPMTSKSGRFIITYNGEIYNFNEIKRELKNKFEFTTLTDTEVILNSFEAWGIEAIKKFNGMFAFAIYDNEMKEFFLVRDRYGIKPLYYEISHNDIKFASEIKSITKVRNKKNVIDKETLIEYFTFQNIFSNKNLIKNIRLLKPGSYIRITNNNINEVNYWDFNFRNALKTKSNLDYQKEFLFLFKQSIKRQSISDVPVSSHLSSGLDSTAITYFLKEEVGNINTYTCGFDTKDVFGLEAEFDESPISKEFATHIGTNHNEYIISSGDMEASLDNLSKIIEEPRLGQSYPNYFLANLVSKKNKVVLTGVGGDELFAGYPWRYFYKEGLLNYGEYIESYYKYWQRLLPNKELSKLLSPIKSDFDNFRTIDIFKQILDKSNIELNSKDDFINNSLYFEAKTFLPGLLTIEDKINMAFGVENRVPFLDNDLVEFAISCPINQKLKYESEDIIEINENIFNKKEKSFLLTKNGKLILRNAFESILPPYITKNFKKGFSGPDSKWFQKKSLNFIETTILKPDALILEYLDRNYIAKLINEHVSGNQNRRLIIWSMIYFEKFLKNYLG